MMNYRHGNGNNFGGPSSFIKYSESVQNPMLNVTNRNLSHVQNDDQCQPTYHAPTPLENNSHLKGSRCAGYNTMAPEGRRFKVYNRPKRIENNVIDLEMKLNVSLF